METKQKRSQSYYMRALHRDIGFFVIGITIVYCLSGIVLIYRDTDFLKSEVMVEKTLPSGMDASTLAATLRMKDFKMVDQRDSIIYFNHGNYDIQTGVVSYTDKVMPGVLRKFINLHKSVSKNPIHWTTFIYGILLLFLAISSFWMFRPGTKKFKRGMIITSIGIIAAIILLLL